MGHFLLHINLLSQIKRAVLGTEPSLGQQRGEDDRNCYGILCRTMLIRVLLIKPKSIRKG